MKKIPLTDIEREALEAFGFDAEKPSKASDCIRVGVRFAQQKEYEQIATLQAELDKVNEDLKNSRTIYSSTRSANIDICQQLETLKASCKAPYMPEEMNKSVGDCIERLLLEAQDRFLPVEEFYQSIRKALMEEQR